MRQSRCFPALLLFLLLTIPALPARAETIVRLQADHIAFYYDRFLVEADGHVRVSTSDGTTITGDTFSMDLKLNRFLIASNVRLTSPGGNISGAAIADFLDFNRVYFVPVIEKPDRWTFENGDYSKPLKGRQMPGDVFYFPDLHGTKVSLTAKSATIGAKSFVRFNGVTSYIFGAGAPLPSFYVYFGANPDMAVNSLAGANMDLTYNFAGNANSISAIHLRSDQQYGVYASFEQHIAGRNGYAVFSVNPGTKFDKFWSLVTDYRFGKRFQLNTYSQLFTAQKLFESPYASSTWSYATGTYAFPQSFLSAQAVFTNYNLLGEGLPKAAPATARHPSQMTLTATTFNHRIGKSPFYENLSYGIGFNNDSYGLQEYGGVTYKTIWNHTLGWTFSLPGFKFGDRDNGYRTYYFNGTYSRLYEWYSVPHYVVTTNTVGSVSRQFSKDVTAYASYGVVNTGDYYRKGGYVPPAQPPVIDGVPVESILAFRGVSTLRTFTLGGSYSTNPNFLATLVYQHHQDFPIPYPGLFQLPPLNNLGLPQYTNYLGQPPNNITGEVRFLAVPHLVLDISRSYYFNYGNLRWSPQTTVQVIAQ
ncbi:MAG TPA: hypothetical protein VFN49_12700 [Candidatus Aquilonibacter sp.]|nr:hypothetical protein [Candidatus Aquilonibacter sp.]